MKVNVGAAAVGLLGVLSVVAGIRDAVALPGPCQGIRYDTDPEGTVHLVCAEETDCPVQSPCKVEPQPIVVGGIDVGSHRECMCQTMGWNIEPTHGNCELGLDFNFQTGIYTKVCVSYTGCAPFIECLSTPYWTSPDNKWHCCY